LVSEVGNKRTGLIGTIVFHAVLLLLCAYLWGVRPPNPPLPDYGVEVNFGVDDTGFGDEQNPTPASEIQADAPQPTTDPDVSDAVPTDAQTQEPEPSMATTSEKESPLEVPDKKPSKPVEQKTKPNETPKENKASTSSSATNSSNSANQSNNNGNKAGTVGDMGKPNGDLSSLNYDGNGGSGGKQGGGASLQINGWKWDDKPDKKDPYNETGKIVFQIKVDAEGFIVDVKPIEKTVSPAVVSFYQDQVEKLTFSKTKDNTEAAGISIGKITFIIKAN